MKTYISLMRGINVGGKNSLKMEDLKKLIEKLGAKQISTYVQSGNVVFIHEATDRKKLARQIAKTINDDFGYKVSVIVISLETFRQIVEANPLALDATKEPRFLHVTFLAEMPDRSAEKSIQAKVAESEAFALTDNAVYLYCPDGYGRTKLNNNFLERSLNTKATTRNWKTTKKLLEMAQKL